MFSTSILQINRNNTILNVESQREIPSRQTRISIAIAPTKNMSRFEWFLEKATEIGIQHIYPIITRYSERKNIKEDRCTKVLLSAMKQSQQFYLPTFHKVQVWKDFIKNDFPEQRFIAYVDAQNNPLSKIYRANNDVIVLIGPEGDFSKEEIEEAFNNNFQAVGLGKNRLRTETAGIVATQILNNINE